MTIAHDPRLEQKLDKHHAWLTRKEEDDSAHDSLAFQTLGPSVRRRQTLDRYLLRE